MVNMHWKEQFSFQYVCSHPGVSGVFHLTESKGLNYVPRVSLVTLFHDRQAIGSTPFYIAQHVGWHEEERSWQVKGVESSIWREY